MSIQYPVVPVGNGEPTLSFSNLKIINLHAMKNIESLDFLEGFRVQGKVEVGNLDGVALPLTILPIQDSPAGDHPDNYEFIQPCCVPKTSGTKKCGSSDECQKSFVNRGTGGLTATIKKIIGTGTLVVDPDEMKVTECESFVVNIDPIDVSIDFTVNEGGGDMGKEGMEAFARAAVATGVANNYIESTINGFFAQESFKEHIVKAVNAALESLP